MTDELAGITKLGFDTSLFIYFVERHSVYLSTMRNIIGKVDKGIITGCCSVITLTEVLVHPRRNGASALEKEYSDLLRHIAVMRLMAITPLTFAAVTTCGHLMPCKWQQFFLSAAKHF